MWYENRHYVINASLSLSFDPAGIRKDPTHPPDAHLPAPARSTAWCIPPSMVTEAPRS